MEEQPEVLKRLALIDKERKREREKKREEGRKDLDPRESTETFLRNFNEEISSIQACLNKLETEVRSEDIKALLDSLLSDLIKTDESVSSAAYYLPPYDVKKSRATLASLRKQIDELRKGTSEKKKFSFSKKSSVVSNITHKEQTKSVYNSTQDNIQIIQNIKGIKNQRDKNISITAEELAAAEYSVSECQNCQIHMLGPLSALHLKNIKNCIIYAGPIKGACFLEDISNSTLFLASWQVRIHDSTSSKFYLRVKSNPIIEHSNKLSFGPLALKETDFNSLSLSQWESWFEDAGLKEENSLWMEVKDFGWLANGQSPNWSLI